MGSLLFCRKHILMWASGWESVCLWTCTYMHICLVHRPTHASTHLLQCHLCWACLVVDCAFLRVNQQTLRGSLFAKDPQSWPFSIASRIMRLSAQLVNKVGSYGAPQINFSWSLGSVRVQDITQTLWLNDEPWTVFHLYLKTGPCLRVCFTVLHPVRHTHKWKSHVEHFLCDY